MAVATASTEPNKTVTTPTPLWAASLVGGIFVLAALGAIFYGIPKLWEVSVASSLKSLLGEFFNGALLLSAQVAGAIALIVFGSRVAGDNPPHGIRGGIFLSISTIFTVFFFARAIGMIVQRMFELSNETALIVFFVALGGFIFLGLRFLRGAKFQKWSTGLEDGGWFSATTFKRNQGHRIRRFTIIGLLIVFGAGIHTLIYNQHLLGMENWDVETPFLSTIVLLPDAQFTIPLVLIFLSVWISFRLVNHPSFADFLIATEAEMNKVSWTPRKALIRDTIVVLTTVFLITMFLFVVDIFWGWFLSRDLVGVLPRTTEYYYVEIRSIPKDNDTIEKIRTVLDDDQRLGFPKDVASQLLNDLADGKSNPIRLRNLSSRQGSKEDGFESGAASRLVDKLQNAGAVAVSVPTKEQKAQLDW